MNTTEIINIYKDRDPRKMPNYTTAEASRYLHISTSTLRPWAKGRGYVYQDIYTFSEPIIGVSRRGIEGKRLMYRDSLI